MINRYNTNQNLIDFRGHISKNNFKLKKNLPEGPGNKDNYMTIQIRTTQISTIQIPKKYLKQYISKSFTNLKKIKNTCGDLIKIYKPHFIFS